MNKLSERILNRYFILNYLFDEKNIFYLEFIKSNLILNHRIGINWISMKKSNN